MKTIKAKKSLGQNFLIDDEALYDISHSIEVAGKHIIEVGPGYGALTEYLVKENPIFLDLVELDQDMIDILERRQKEEWMSTNVTIHHQDVLTLIPPYSEYSVIANIPYYITSPILFHFLYPKREALRKEDLIQSGEDSPTTGNLKLETFNSPQEMVIMMQEEVGEKILEGRARKPHHSYLSLAMELACDDIEIIRYVGKESFDPAPKVDSIVLKFTVKKNRNQKEEEQLLSLWRTVFTHPRKTLLSNLRGSHYDIELVKKWLTECGYNEKVRAEAVSMENWKRFLKMEYHQ